MRLTLQTRTMEAPPSDDRIVFEKGVVHTFLCTYCLDRKKLLRLQVNSTSDVVVVGEPEQGDECAVGVGIPLQ